VTLPPALARLDIAGLRFARTVGHTPQAERAIGWFSKLGEHGACWLALGAAGAAADRERRGRWLRAAAVVAGAYGVNVAVKYTIRRPRPDLPDLPPLIGTPGAMSFPSAHSTTSFAAARLYSDLGMPAAPAYALATALVYSRLYLGLHYPSDIGAGVVLGTAIGTVAR
jgi:membrane-associated phospholipid phosphatase